MNPGRFYMPGYMGIRNASMISPMIRMANSAPNRVGLFSKITNGIRSVNWSGLLNGANKTLNVVNQTIPLVRQAGPMVSNMKNMLRIARAFGNETVKTNTNTRNNNSNEKNVINNVNSTNIDSSYNSENLVQKKEVSDNNYPNFFV